ncbi:MAG: DUF4892 domain-containing protein [Pseudomonadales bacterium]
MMSVRVGFAMLVVGLLVSFTPPAAVAASDDVAGSRDPYGVERVARSRIVNYQRDQEMRQHDFVMGRVDRIRRELRVEDQLRLEATFESATYQMPDGVSVAEAVAHYQGELGGDLLFRCEGRGCGRSNDWANQIFNQAILYGPDVNQYYSAWEWQGRLVGLYVIERGNRRVYAHLQFYEPQEVTGIQPNVLLTRRLSERGWAPIEAVTPSSSGEFAEPDQQVLAALAEPLSRFSGQSVYLVCHLYGPRQPEELLAVSQRCAERGAELIGLGADAADSALPDLTPYGAGPLLPRTPAYRSRLELVLPVEVSQLVGE